MRPFILAKYHFASLWNWRASYLGRFIEPVAYLLFLSSSLEGPLRGRVGDYSVFVLTGLAVLLSFRSATASMSDVSNDRKWGVFAVYTLQGGSVPGYILSILLFSGTVFLAQFTVLVVTALAALPGPMPGPLAVAGIAGFGLLFVIGWTGIGAAVGGRVDSYAVRDLLVTVTSLPVILAAPIFVPLDTRWVRYVAVVNPLTYQVGAMREPSWASIGAGAAWAVVGILAAILMLRSADRLSREG